MRVSAARSTWEGEPSGEPRTASRTPPARRTPFDTAQDRPRPPGYVAGARVAGWSLGSGPLQSQRQLRRAGRRGVGAVGFASSALRARSSTVRFHAARSGAGRSSSAAWYGLRRQAVVEDRAADGDLEAEAVDRAELAGALAGLEEGVDAAIDLRGAAAGSPASITSERSISSRNSSGTTCGSLGHQVDVAVDELLEPGGERRRRRRAASPPRSAARRCCSSTAL